MFEQLIGNLLDREVPVTDEHLSLEVTLDARGEVLRLAELLERVEFLREQLGLESGRIPPPFQVLLQGATDRGLDPGTLPMPIEWLSYGQVRDLALARLRSVDDSDWEHHCLTGPSTGLEEMMAAVELGQAVGDRYVLSVHHHCTFLHEAAWAGILRPLDGGRTPVVARTGGDGGDTGDDVSDTLEPGEWARGDDEGDGEAVTA